MQQLLDNQRQRLQYSLLEVRHGTLCVWGGGI